MMHWTLSRLGYDTLYELTPGFEALVAQAESDMQSGAAINGSGSTRNSLRWTRPQVVTLTAWTGQCPVETHLRLHPNSRLDISP